MTSLLTGLTRNEDSGGCQRFTVVSLTGEAVETAYATVLPDFEDALQLEAAKAADVGAVVTRNKKHFRQ